MEGLSRLTCLPERAEAGVLLNCDAGWRPLEPNSASIIETVEPAKRRRVGRPSCNHEPKSLLLASKARSTCKQGHAQVGPSQRRKSSESFYDWDKIYSSFGGNNTRSYMVFVNGELDAQTLRLEINVGSRTVGVSIVERFAELDFLGASAEELFSEQFSSIKHSSLWLKLPFSPSSWRGSHDRQCITLN